MPISKLKELLVKEDGAFKFTLVEKTEDIGETGRFCIDMSTQDKRVLFDGYIDLHQFEGLLLIEQDLKVLALVLPDKSDSEQEGWLQNQLNRVNPVLYTLRRTPPQHSLSARNGDGQDLAKYTVEVLILTEAHHKAGLVQALNHLARMSEQKAAVDLLHSLSVNLLLFSRATDGICFGPNAKERINSIKAAMPWLLSHYRDWTKKLSAENNKKILEIEKQNYRLPGKRTLTLAPNANLHLFHGYNGSGKSALAEVIELWHTKQIARLTHIAPDEYHGILVNHHAAAPEAHVKIRFGEQESNAEYHQIKIAEGSQDKHDKVKGGTSILNQELIDGLSRARGKERLSLFERSFFRQDSGKVALMEQKESEIQQWQTPLANRLGLEEAYADNPVDERLHEALGNQLVSTARAIYLPMAPNALLDLKNLLPPAQARLIQPLVNETDFERSGEILRQLQQPLKAVFSNATLLETLQQGRQVIADFADWHLINQTRESYASLWRNYAITDAKSDLLEQRLQLDRFCQLAFEASDSQALQAQSQSIGIDEDLLLSGGSREQFAEKSVSLKQQKRILQQQLQAVWDGETLEQRQNPTNKTVTPVQALQLNKVGQYLRDKNGQPITRLGDALLGAVNHNHIEDTATVISLGNQGWARPLLGQLEALIGVVEVWQAADSHWQNSGLYERGAFSSISWWQLCDDARKALNEYQSLQTQMGESFLKKLSDEDNELIKPLNELLKLFTPARWLYKNLMVKRDSDTQQLSLQIVRDNGDPVDAAVVWNTAEMNLFAIAMFLLCSNYEQHNRPTNTLVMDDPLQNMDELTATYFARGLAKLVYDWHNKNSGQQLWMLFHGEHAIDKFSEELPAAVYQLPWATEQDDHVTQQTSLCGHQLFQPYPFHQQLTIETVDTAEKVE